jgi:lysine 6-dehydrogenase
VKNVVILGAGRVGIAIANDLCRQYAVTSADADADGLERLKARGPIHTVVADLSRPDAVKRIIRKADLVIGVLPGHMGFETLKTVIESGKNTVDISFFSEDPFNLTDLALSHHVTAVVDGRKQF